MRSFFLILVLPAIAFCTPFREYETVTGTAGRISSTGNKLLGSTLPGETITTVVATEQDVGNRGLIDGVLGGLAEGVGGVVRGAAHAVQGVLGGGRGVMGGGMMNGGMMGSGLMGGGMGMGNMMGGMGHMGGLHEEIALGELEHQRLHGMGYGYGR